MANEENYNDSGGLNKSLNEWMHEWLWRENPTHVMRALGPTAEVHHVRTTKATTMDHSKTWKAVCTL